MKDLKLKLLATDYFEDTDFLDKYVDLIFINQHTLKDSFRTQSHHIVPRCLAEALGQEVDNSTGNLVNLIYRDHILAHYYLMRASKNQSFRANMAYSVQFVIAAISDKTEAEILKELPQIQECYEIMRQAKLTYKHSDEVKVKLAISTSGRAHISKNGINKNVKIDELQNWLDQGWVRGWQANYKASNRQKIGIIFEGKNKYIDPTELDYYLANGAVIGGKKHKTPRADKGQKRSSEIIAKLTQNRRGLICVHHIKTGKVHYIKPELLEQYLTEGYALGRGIQHGGFKDRIWVHKDMVSKLIPKSELDQYMTLGYVLGRFKKFNTVL
jgi:hypothetical protein